MFAITMWTLFSFMQGIQREIKSKVKMGQKYLIETIRNISRIFYLNPLNSLGRVVCHTNDLCLKGRD